MLRSIAFAAVLSQAVGQSSFSNCTKHNAAFEPVPLFPTDGAISAKGAHMDWLPSAEACWQQCNIDLLCSWFSWNVTSYACYMYPNATGLELSPYDGAVTGPQGGNCSNWNEVDSKNALAFVAALFMHILAMYVVGSIVGLCCCCGCIFLIFLTCCSSQKKSRAAMISQEEPEKDDEELHIEPAVESHEEKKPGCWARCLQSCGCAKKGREKVTRAAKLTDDKQPLMQQTSYAPSNIIPYAVPQAQSSYAPSYLVEQSYAPQVVYAAPQAQQYYYVQQPAQAQQYVVQQAPQVYYSGGLQQVAAAPVTTGGAYILQQFDQIDSNGDGVITREEFEAMQRGGAPIVSGAVGQVGYEAA